MAGSLRFSLREHQNSLTYPPNITFLKPSGSVLRINESGSNTYARGYAFIVVPRTWLGGKYLRFNVGGHFGAGADRVVNKVEIWDGEYDRSSNTDFPSGSAFLSKGNGKLQDVWSKNFHGSYGPETHDVLIDVSGGSEDKCTIFFIVIDSWAADYNEQFDIDWVEFNTGSGGSGTLYDEQFTDSVHMEVTGTYGDYGYISTGEIVVVKKAKPSSIVPLMRGMDLISAVKPFSKRFPKLKPRLVA